MKQRVLSILVRDSEGNVKFEKEVATPQDLMAALQLFECDGVSVLATMHVIEVSPSGKN